MTWRLHRPGLGARIVTVVSVLLIGSWVTVGVVTAIELRSDLTRRLDQQLASAEVRYSVSLEVPGDGDADDEAFQSEAGEAAGTFGARVVDGRVTAVGAMGADPDDGSLSAADRTAIERLDAHPGPRVVQLPDLGRYRVTVTPHNGGLIVVGLPMRMVDQPVHHLIVTELIVFAVTIVITGLAGYVSIERALRPLTRIAATARGVSALPLSSGTVNLPEQVDNPRPGTEIGDVTTAFNKMLVHIQSALKRRSEDEERLRHFVADASHELRTPVAVIASHAEFAQLDDAADPDAIDHALTRIRAETSRMGQMVQDLLLLARLDSGRRMARESVDLTHVVLDAATDVSRTAPTHRWQLDLPEQPVAVEGDVSALHQALANLLANARDHTPSGTTVLILLRMVDEQVELSVHDDGPGVPTEFLPHILERFARADQARARDGAGLGLAIVDAIVQAHSGTLTATSTAGDTAFTILVPTTQPADERVSPGDS